MIATSRHPDPEHADRAPRVLVFDLGGTWLRAALADSGGRLLVRDRRPTPAGGPDAVIAAMVAAARQVDPEGAAAAVGIAAPGPLDPRAGVVLRMPNLAGWRDVPLAARLADALDRPTHLHNDASVAALGEARAGAGVGADPLVYLTLSTGIGGGIVVGGRLFDGRHGLAGELGHVLLDPAGPACGLGHPGCLEALASGSALARRVREALAAGAIAPDSPLGILTAEEERSPDAGLLAEAARQGDAWALAAWRSAGDALGRGLASIINTLDPERIVLGGGLVAAWDLWSGAMDAALAAAAVTWPERACPILPAALGDDAGLVGAALWVGDLLADGLTDETVRPPQRAASPSR